jgi:hypothetical protein
MTLRAETGAHLGTCASVLVHVVVNAFTAPGGKVGQMAAPNLSMTSEHGGHRVIVDLDGRRYETPPVEHVFFYVGVGVLVATNLVEPPIAIALVVGHALLELTRRPGLQALGSALEEA